MSQWPGWIVGILIGVVLMFIAHWAIGQAPDTVEKLVADVELVQTFVGAVGVAIGLGSLSFKAASVGLLNMDANTVAGPGALAIASALLLV
jgi:hypothetical protein